MGAICGIVGDLGKEYIQKIINTMLNTMAFRGGDYKGVYIEPLIGLGVNTYQFQKQPVTNETGKIVAICDGEIYNWVEVKHELKSKGHQLHSNSPFEVIPHLYEELGKDFASKLNGIFVIALYDANSKSLLLVRDHMGSRSVFYSFFKGNFIFASTIKALLHTNLINTEILPEAVNLYFASTCVPHPYTMIKDIKSVRPAYALILEKGKIEEHEYWTLANIEEDYKTSEREFQEQIRELLIDAIRIRSTDNQKTGAILSGGVDSSLICAVVANSTPKNNLQTFSIRYKETFYDDSFLQNIMYTKYSNLIPNQVIFTQDMVIDLLYKVVKNCDYPLNNASAMGTYLCMELAKNKELEKILEGEAADELFCGGGGVVGENLIQLITKLTPSWIKKLFLKPFTGSLQIGKTGKIAAFRRFCHRICMDPIERMLTWLPAFDRETRKQLLIGEWKQYIDICDELEPGKFYMEKAHFKDPINLYQYGICKTYLPNDLLFKNERMAAAHGIINRTPFIDYRLVELAFKIPGKYKIKGYTNRSAEKKLIYRKAIQGLIPDEILWRKKTRGFSQPVAIWLRTSMKNFVQNTLLDNHTIQRGIFNPSFLERIFEEHISGKENRARLIWSILTLELWLREFGM